MRTFVLIAMMLTCGAAAGCGSGGAQPPANESAANVQPAATNRIDVPASVRRNLGITFARVEKRRVGQTLRLPGRFELLPQARQEYRALLDGRVECLATQYQRVDEGTVLYRLQSPEWRQLQDEIFDAEFAIEAGLNDAAVAKAALDELSGRVSLLRDRLEPLVQAGFSRPDLEKELGALELALPKAQAELRAREAAAAAQRKRFEVALGRAGVLLGVPVSTLQEMVSVQGGPQRARWQLIDWIDVPARRSGVVDAIHISSGGWSQVGELVLSTIDPGQVRFRGSALQADLPRLRDGLPAMIVASSDAPHGAPAAFALGLEADADTRTLDVIAMPEQVMDWMRPGVSAFVEIETVGTGAEELAIPREAVVQDGLSQIIFRRDPADPNKVIRMEADLGLSDGRWTVINSGVKLGDEVVLDGVYELKLATSGTAQKGGHFHADGTFHAEH